MCSEFTIQNTILKKGYNKCQKNGVAVHGTKEKKVLVEDFAYATPPICSNRRYDYRDQRHVEKRHWQNLQCAFRPGKYTIGQILISQQILNKLGEGPYNKQI